MNVHVTVRVRQPKGNPIVGFIMTRPHGQSDEMDYERIGRSLVQVLEEHPGATLLVHEKRSGDEQEVVEQARGEREEATRRGEWI